MGLVASRFSVVEGEEAFSIYYRLAGTRPKDHLNFTVFKSKGAMQCLYSVRDVTPSTSVEL